MNETDSERGHTVALFRYGLIADLVHLVPGSKGLYAQIAHKAEAEAMAQTINAAHPDFVWVGLGTPKQERWMDANIGRLDAPVLLGVGAAFDIHAGLLPQAPAWMQQRGLEWLYRLVKEPRRLWKRYLGNNPRFVLKVLRHPPRIVSIGQLAGGSPPQNPTTESEVH